MKLTTRLKKLQEDKKLLIEAIKQAEAKASVRQRKRDTRAKIILGTVVVSMPEDEREALLSMLLSRMTEKDQGFITEHLAGNQSTKPEAPSGLN